MDLCNPKFLFFAWWAAGVAVWILSYQVLERPLQRRLSPGETGTHDFGGMLAFGLSLMIGMTTWLGGVSYADSEICMRVKPSQAERRAEYMQLTREIDRLRAIEDDARRERQYYEKLRDR